MYACVFFFFVFVINFQSSCSIVFIQGFEQGTVIQKCRSVLVIIFIIVRHPDDRTVVYLKSVCSITHKFSYKIDCNEICQNNDTIAKL